MQVAQYPGATLTTLHEDASCIYAAVAHSRLRGSVKLAYRRTSAGRDRISVCAMPAGPSPVHLNEYHTEYLLTDVSLADAEQLLERYWGVIAVA